ncbi:macro domain-containing protein [Shivajiella indica]|uniref:Macro domain-containing protein n=1 Tax=Shivajiella indica TaxID=872115 RepID=A0ABW5BE98_9BACT
MMSVKVGPVTIECIQGDITSQSDMDAVVNAANTQLAPGGGVAGVIHLKAGPGLYEECKPLAPIQTGEAVITSGHGLPNPFVIHCLGPIYGQDKQEAKLLANCYRNALKIAEEKGLKSIAFPAISTGIFGYPIAEAANIAFRTFAKEANKLQHIRTIRMVLFSEKDLKEHLMAFQQVFRD